MNETQLHKNNTESAEFKITKEQREAATREEGLLIAQEIIKDRLATTTVRPLLIFVNGLTGSGKTSFGIDLEEKLSNQENGLKAVSVETDLYGDDRFKGEDFLAHKKAWEAGTAFPRHNIRTHKDEIISTKPDVIILTGAGEAQEHVKDKADLNILMLANPLDRISQRIFRDHIVSTDSAPNPEQMLKELAKPDPDSEPDPGFDYIDEFEHRKAHLAKLSQPPDLVVRNFYPNTGGLKFEIVDNRLHFTAKYNGVDYDLWQEISPARLERLKQVLDLQ